MLHTRLVEPFGPRQAEVYAPRLVWIGGHFGGKPLPLRRLQRFIIIRQRVAAHEILARDELARRAHLVDDPWE